MEDHSCRAKTRWARLLGVACITAACGTPPSAVQVSTSAVHAVPEPRRLLSLVAIALRDGLAIAPPQGACASRAYGQEPILRESWRYDACDTGAPGVALSGERYVWGASDPVGANRGGSYFDYVRRRADGSAWEAQGQIDWSQQTGENTSTAAHALMHGTMSPTGEGADVSMEHVYAYHLSVTQPMDGREGQWLSGVAQLNFAAVEATSQIKLSGLWITPACRWPVAGHVSMATTAGDGSFVDATLVFTQTCGMVKDDRGILTSLATPWEEGA